MHNIMVVEDNLTQLSDRVSNQLFYDVYDIMQTVNVNTL